MSLAAEVVEQLRAALTTIGRAKARTIAVHEQVVETQLELRATTDGSSAEKPAEAKVRLEQAQVKLDEAVAEFDAGASAVEAYIAVVGGTEGGPKSPETTRSTKSRQRRSVTSPPRSPTELPQPSTRPPKPDMEKAAEIRPHVGKRKTVGRLVVNGDDVEGEIWSGRDGPGRHGPELSAPWRYMETMTEHVEGHAAAIMRRDQIAEAQLYISRRPCQEVPYGCRWQLVDALPRNSKLTVFTVDRRGGVKPKVFIGTGEGRDTNGAAG